MSGGGFLISLFLIWNFTGLMSQTTEVVVNLNNRDFLVSDHFDDGLIFIQDMDVFASDLIDGIDEILKNLNEQDKNIFMKFNASLMEIYKKTRREDNPILVRYRLK